MNISLVPTRSMPSKFLASSRSSKWHLLLTQKDKLLNFFKKPNRNRPKVFCIGRNKTGTTSIKVFLQRVGYKIGSQRIVERYLDDWHRGKFARIVAYCNTADAFQDVPFSLPETYKKLDAAFPGSKFILTVRNNADDWYESLVRFQTQIVGKGRLPTAEDLQAFGYRGKGWLWRAHQYVYGVDESTLYNPDIYKNHYITHNEEAREYFKNRPQDFLEINLYERSEKPRSLLRGCRAGAR